MKLVVKRKTAPKVVGRLKKRVKIRRKVAGSTERPRLCVFRSNSHIYASLVDDTTGNTLATASSLALKIKTSGCEEAKLVGLELGKLAQKQNISEVVFDRSGYLYHGRIKFLADGAREAGLNF